MSVLFTRPPQRNRIGFMVDKRNRYQFPIQNVRVLEHAEFDEKADGGALDNRAFQYFDIVGGKNNG